MSHNLPWGFLGLQFLHLEAEDSSRDTDCCVTQQVPNTRK